ncbi:SEC10/PgrA surface exclusion domain-containing protein [Gemella sp.]
MIKRKQRFSLRKNKIGAMSVLLGISFVGAVASSSDVKANEISEEKAPKLIEKEVVGKTTKQDVEKAQAKVDASKEAESLKNKAIENKTTEITNNDNEISKIKADIERDKDATDENINKAEKNVESATEELKNKNSELLKTNAEKEERESDLVLVKKDVADKTKDLESKQAKAKEIKDEIDGTENVTKKLESEKAKNEDIKKELETEKSNKVVAEKELEKAKEFDAKLAEDTKNAEENSKAKQEELKDKTAELDDAKKDEATKKAEYDAVVMPYGRNVKYKIALDQRFVDKFKEYMDYKLNWKQKGITIDEMLAKRKELRKELLKIEKEIKYEFVYNRYSHEDDYEIDLRNMSEEERLKMSQYGIYLLNQIRSQFGLEPLKVNKNSMQLAKEITDTVVRDNHYGLFGGHYIKGISEVAAKHGLLRDGNFYENLYNGPSSTYSDHKMSRNELYEHVYNSVMAFFYEGEYKETYPHAQALYQAHTPMGLGVAHFENVGYLPNINRFPKDFIEKYKQYVEFDEFGNILKFKPMPIDIFDEYDKLESSLPKRGIIKISYINVEEDSAIPGSVDKDGYPIYDDESKEAMERAKQNFITKYSNESKDTVELPAVPDLESFKKAYEDAVKVRESKERPVVDAKANLDSATKVLDELKATEKQTEKATAKVQEIDTKINNLTAKADEQQKVVDQLELDNVKYIEKMTKLAADLDAAQQDVEESTKLLDQAKSLQKNIEGEIATATAKISQLENEIEASKKALDEAKDNFAKIRKARLELDKNKEKLAKATAVKAELEKDLSTLKAELIAISKQLADDTKELERIQRQYKLENFKWAVLADNNTIDPIEFDLEKYLKDEEEKKKKSEIRPEQPITPETPERPEEPIKPGAPDKSELPNLSIKPGEKVPGSSNNQPDLQRTSVNSNGLKTLPNTGESQSGMATVAGLVALAVAARLRKKDKQN